MDRPAIISMVSRKISRRTGMYDALFKPIKIGPIEISNRICRTGHGANVVLKSPGADLIEARIAYYAARARGGFGLTIMGINSVHPSSMTETYPKAYDRSSVGEYARYAAALKPLGQKLFQQLWHGG